MVVSIEIEGRNTMTTTVSADTPKRFHNVVDEHPVFHGAKDLRDWKQVKGIVLHQTACFLGNKVPRWYSVTCHVGATMDGQVIYNNDLRRRLWHGHGFNRDTVGIEIDGNFRGIEELDYTRWKPGGGPAHLSPEQCQAARDAVAFIVGEVAANGGQVTHLWAHRQSSDQRQADPGSDIWRKVGLWAEENLELAINPAVTLGTGLAIPVEWDLRSVWDWNGNIPERKKDKGWWRIQESLNDLMEDTKLVVDGIPGLRTKMKLRKYQNARGLYADSVFGPMTWAMWAEDMGLWGISDDSVGVTHEGVNPDDWKDPVEAPRIRTRDEAKWTPDEGFGKPTESGSPVKEDTPKLKPVK